MSSSLKDPTRTSFGKFLVINEACRGYNIEMKCQHFFSHSPFSPSTVSNDENRSLLLQLILYELIKANDSLKKTASHAVLPFDWSSKVGSANKVEEHASLLSFAFPELLSDAQLFINTLHLPCKELVSSLEPFIMVCQESESLLLFLIKHQKFLNIKSVLDKLSPKGEKNLKMVVKARYKKRGFLISKWKHSNDKHLNF